MKENQEQMVLKYMQTHGAITPWDALREFGCMRLGARIYDLRRSGYDIITERREGKNRRGAKVSWAEYRLRSKG